MDVGGDAGVVFKKSVSNYWEFEKLETYIIQPNKSYIDDSLGLEDGGPVTEYIEKHRGILGKNGRWALYMISGIVIARGVKSAKREDKNETGANLGANVSAMAVGEIGVSVDVGGEKGVGVEFKGASDFVWALRLTKISKGSFGKDWEMETFSKGATYSLGKEEERRVRLKMS